MELDLYQIDAFAGRPFEGNPAAVVPLKRWLDDSTMQSIALENNLSETAFFIPVEDHYHIRWFTPLSEVDLCGHATLASAWVIFNELNSHSEIIQFESRSGILSVSRKEEDLVLDFPAQPPVECKIRPEIKNAFDKKILQCLASEDYLVVFENEEDVTSVNPEMEILKNLDLRGVIITSVSEKYDFVARFFAPKFGVNEDPVTGSAFTQLAPFWSQKLMKAEMSARQVSYRGGDVNCTVKDNRVFISGKAVKFMQGRIII